MTHKFWACSSNAACVIPLTMWTQKEIYLEILKAVAIWPVTGQDFQNTK